MTRYAASLAVALIALISTAHSQQVLVNSTAHNNGTTWTAPEFLDLQDGTRIRLLPPAVLPSQPVVAAGEFVTRNRSQLFLQGQPFYFFGFNAYWFIDAASWGEAHGRQQVAEAMAAAKALGMRTVRTWAFNTQLPSGANTYDEGQFQALDYIVYAARVMGLKLILPLGNFWNAYKGPEEFVWYAVGPAGRGILDFYSHPAVMNLYKSHIQTILTRVNTFTGLAYRDDPTIMGWDVLNEPRCPGCETPALQNLVIAWMRQMTDFTKQTAPRQLVALGTEGFFMGVDNQGLNLANPGPGAQCEGEDWLRLAALPSVDYLTLHVYERHMEWQPVQAIGRPYTDPDWFFCGFSCYINWFVRYVQVHMEVAESLTDPKPLLIQEFGLTWWSFDVRDRRVLFAVIGQMLRNSSATNGPLAGAMVWNGAHNDSPDQDGYNVYLNRLKPKPLPAPPPALRPLPPITPYLLNFSTQLKAGMYGPMVQASGRRLLEDTRHLPVSNSGAGGRQLLYQSDKLDGFRRGWERGSCAHESSRTWRPPTAWTNGTRSDEVGVSGLSAETLAWMAVPDVPAWRAATWPLEEVDLLSWIGTSLRSSTSGTTLAVAG